MSLDKLAHEERKSCGQGIDALLNRQTFEPTLQRLDLGIFLWLCGRGRRRRLQTASSFLAIAISYD